MPTSPRKSFGLRPQNATTTHVPVLPSCAGHARRDDGRLGARSEFQRGIDLETDGLMPIWEKRNGISPGVISEPVLDKGRDAESPPGANIVVGLEHLRTAV